MKFVYQSARSSGGEWTLRHGSPELGTVEVSASTRDAALEKLRQELRYRLEFCPCTGEALQDLAIELVETRETA